MLWQLTDYMDSCRLMHCSKCFTGGELAILSVSLGGGQLGGREGG